MKTLAVTYWQGLSPALRRYYRASLWPCLLFPLLALGHGWAVAQPGLGVPARAAFAIAPMLVLGWMFAGYLHFLRDCDELERRIETTALAWAAGVALHGAMAGMFLFDAGLLHWPSRRAMAALGLLLVGSYVLVRAWLHRRYA